MKPPVPSRPQKMALIPTCVLSCFAVLSVQAEETPVTPQPPDTLLGPLFNDMQNTRFLPSQKTFVDAMPNSDPLMILADYRMQQSQNGSDLHHFVNVNFTPPREDKRYVPPEEQSLRKHVDGLWPVLTRSTESTEEWDFLLPPSEPYVVPDGCFHEVYCWDSYFTTLGFAESGYWDKITDMMANFAHRIDTYDHIPNGNRSYYLSHSQLPFFALMVELLAQYEGDATLKQHLPQMQKRYAYWMDGVENLQVGQQEKRAAEPQDGTLLSRYWDDRDMPRPEPWAGDIATTKGNPNQPATKIYRDLRSTVASGWGFSSRWMDNPQQLNTLCTTSIAPVDLNSLMFRMEKILARASKAVGDNAMANRHEILANAHQKGIKKYLRDDQQGWHADYGLKSHKVRNQLTATALFPLYVDAVAKDRANKMATATKTHLL